MTNYKVFLPCAGVGARLGEFTDNVNKALLSVGNKPVISHIVEKFDEDIEIVVALGYKGNYIRQFLTLAYPNRNFTFVDIDIYEGEKKNWQIYTSEERIRVGTSKKINTKLFKSMCCSFR